MTLSWDASDERVVIEVFPYTEAAVITPEQLEEDLEDLVEPEPDEVLLVRLPAAAARAFVERARTCSVPVGPTAPSAASRSTPTVTCACAPTASGDVTREVMPRDDWPTGELTLHGRIMPASNATFVGEIDGVQVVYKPVAGERPLWDFPDGTLADRERAAYLVSEALGWNVVPATVLGDGPHGPGMVQRWQEPDDDQVAVDPRGGVAQVPDGFAARLRRHRRPRPAGLADPRGLSTRCAGWRSSTSSSTTPTARAATSSR